MVLPFKNEDSLAADIDLETFGAMVRELDKEDTTNLNIFDSINNLGLELDKDDSWKRVTDECREMFSETFFDDTYDSLFGRTSFGHWSEQSNDFSGALIQHDCMWAGYCLHSSHKIECDRNLNRLVLGSADMPRLSTVVPQTSQQSLLKSNLKNAGIPVINMLTPHTPPMSDDDEKILCNLVSYSMNILLSMVLYGPILSVVNVNAETNRHLDSPATKFLSTPHK